jgi:hypothetical protein
VVVDENPKNCARCKNRENLEDLRKVKAIAGVSGALFVGKAIIGGAIGTAASWGTSRFLDYRFPPSKK